MAFRSWLLVATLLAGVSSAADWPEFRGPGQQGHATETGLPLTWSENEHVVWKTDIDGLGWSSPAVVDGTVWLTTARDEGRSLRVVALDASTGAIARDVEVLALDDPGPIHGKNSHASPTPVVADGRVYAHFGSHGTVCLSAGGEVVWKTRLVYNHRHGPAGSPVLWRNLLIIACDGTDVQDVVALDAATGAEVWRTSRGEGRMAYSTPTLVDVDGETVVVSSGGEWTICYDPATGKERWRFRYPGGYSNVPRPVVHDGRVFVSSGYDTPTLYALDLAGPNAADDPDGAGRVAWKVNKGAPRNASPLVVGDELYFVSDNGVISCVDAATGALHWQERLGGDCSASPLFADGRIYVTNETGETKVIKPGTTYEELAVNVLPGRTLASLAAADGALFLRTDTALYRLDDAR